MNIEDIEFELKNPKLREMLENDEITEETSETVQLILNAENLTEFESIDEYDKTITINDGTTYTWRDIEEDAKEEARESLMEGEIWRMQVAAQQTKQSLEDWVDHVINVNVNDWQSELCRYDGASHDLDHGKIYWRTN